MIVNSKFSVNKKNCQNPELRFQQPCFIVPLTVTVLS